MLCFIVLLLLEISILKLILSTAWNQLVHVDPHDFIPTLNFFGSTEDS